jgi:hypothetical protein
LPEPALGLEPRTPAAKATFAKALSSLTGRSIFDPSNPA